MDPKDLRMTMKKRLIEHSKFYADKARRMEQLAKILPGMDTDEYRLIIAMLKEEIRYCK